MPLDLSALPPGLDTPDALRPTLDILAAHAADSEAARQLAPESARAMAEAGLFRTLVPRRCGGEEATLRDMADRVRLASAACPAAGWVLMVSLAHDFVIGSFPEQAQDEVWGGDLGGPDDATPGSLAPGGVLEPAARDGVDGWLAKGKWPFNSGAVHGKWFLLGAVDRSGGAPQLYHVVVPRADLTLSDDWHPLGLKGTGSVDAVADGIFIPAHRGIDSGILLGAKSAWAGRQATRLYRTPILPGLAVHIAAAMLGMAWPAYAAAMDSITGQKDRYTLKAKLERPGMHLRLAEADAELRAAGHLLDEALGLLESMAGAEPRTARTPPRAPGRPRDDASLFQSDANGGVRGSDGAGLAPSNANGNRNDGVRGADGTGNVPPRPEPVEGRGPASMGGPDTAPADTNPADTVENRARTKYLAAYTGELCRRAVDRLISATGARSAFDDSPLQRAFRDLTMASKHELINLDGSALTYGRLMVGLDSGGTPL